MRKSSAILLAVIVGIVTCAATYLVTALIIKPGLYVGKGSLSAEEFVKVEKIINEDYLNEYTMEDIQYAGLKAMVAALGDPYSVYYTPEEFNELNKDMSGEYTGLGMVIRMDEETGEPVVESFLEDSSAEEAGVKKGDIIAGVNGQDVKGMTIQDIAMLCLGEEGTSLTMQVKRNGKTLEFGIVRRAVERDMVTYSMLDDSIAYMDIIQFGGNCEELFGEGMDFFIRKGAKGVIIDLRDNPGGLMDTVTHVLDRLLPEGTLVYTEDKNGEKEVWTSDADCIDIPLTLLVNGNTASAAEIFAGAVQDYGWGKVVGTTTYGKGVVQQVIPIESTGGGMKITISEYFTPDGRSINGLGIYPDYYVNQQQDLIDNPQDYSFDEDVQVNKAIEVMKQAIGE